MIKKYWSFALIGVLGGWLGKKIEPFWLALLTGLGVGIVVGALDLAWRRMTGGAASKALPPN